MLCVKHGKERSSIQNEESPRLNSQNEERLREPESEANEEEANEEEQARRAGDLGDLGDLAESRRRL